MQEGTQRAESGGMYNILRFGFAAILTTLFARLLFTFRPDCISHILSAVAK